MSEPAITSVHNPRVKLVRKLHEPRARRREGLFLLEGTTLVAEALAAGWPLDEAFATPDWLDRHPWRDPVPLTTVAPHVMAAMSGLESPEGILATARLPARAALPPIGPASLWLVADSVRDPGNLGGMIRTADAAGADAVLIGPGTADPWSLKTLRASMGSVLHVAVADVPDLAQAHAESRESGMRWVALAPRAGQSLYRAELAGPLALRVGNEAAGLSAAALADADQTVFIPLPGRAESLNAAAAAAVVMFEIVRRREA